MLPDEILLEILSRLPVKSLLRFKCVSKPLLSLINSTDFTKLHLNQSIKINPKIIFPTYEDTYAIDYETSSYDDIKGYDFPLNDSSLIGTCNGLVCVCDKAYYMELWNPATKGTAQLPYAEVDDELIDEEHDVVMGFGYDSSEDQYKVVRSVFFFRDENHSEFEQCEVKIYTLGTKEWREIDSPPCCLGNHHMVPQVNGALHWLAGSPIIASKLLDSKIVSFDVGKEEFRMVPWIDENDNLEVTLGVLQGCLSALVSYNGDKRIGVWLMKDYSVKESWTRLFSLRTPVSGIEFSSIEPLVLRDNGHMLLKSAGELYCYDTISGEVATYRLCDIPDCCYTAHTFAESLVSIASLVP